MPEKSSKKEAPGTGEPGAKTEAGKLETDEWVFTVNRETGALIKIERIDPETGKRAHVSLEEFGQEFMKRAEHAFKIPNASQQSANPSGSNMPSPGWGFGPYAGYW